MVEENTIVDRELHITDLLDVGTLQKMQDAFSKMTGMAVITTNADGTAVTEGSLCAEFCTNFTRKTELGCSRCEQCDKLGAERALRRGRSITYFCHADMVEFAAPVMAGEQMVGCIIGGQVRTDAPEELKVKSIARELGLDPEDYWKAACKVSIMPKEAIDRAAEFLYTIANILSDMAYSRYLMHRAKVEIERAANMKSDFLANMSHEIRTPMNAVIGMAEMALREELPENARQYINEIKVSGKSLLTIINDILDFSKIESGKMDIQPVEYEPMSIINDITNIVMARLGDKEVEFILDVNPDIPHRLLGDNDRIKQVLLNITNNAIKFTNQGQVILHFGFEQRSEDEILLKLAVEDTGIGIKEQDLSKLFQAFQQLDSKRNRNIEGTGLGLAISKRLLSLMDGSISVQSEYGKGSTFAFELPQKVLDGKASITIKDKKAIAAAGLVANGYVRHQLKASVRRLGAKYVKLQKEEEIYALQEQGVSYLFVDAPTLSEGLRSFVEGNPQITLVWISEGGEDAIRELANVRIVKKPVYTLNIAQIFNNESLHFDYEEQNEDLFEFIAPEAEVLIVDDNAINLTVAEGLMEPLKMKLDSAASGKEALEKISKKRYDIVFMDHMMPEMDGVETTHAIRKFYKKYADVPIIALTANAVDGTMEMFLKEGMNDFVAKPIELRILVSKIKRWLPVEKIQKISKQELAAMEQEKEKVTLPEIGDLDVQTAYTLLGSEKLFWSVLKDYYRVIEQKATTIKALEEAEDWSAYTIEVHALKSASRQIGAHVLADQAARLEQAGNERDGELIHAATKALLSRYRSYLPVLEPFFVENEEDGAEKEPVAADILKALFAQLREAMDDLDMDGMEAVVEEMKKYRYEGTAAELFKRLQTAVENIDVETCEDILAEWEQV